MCELNTMGWQLFKYFLCLNKHQMLHALHKSYNNIFFYSQFSASSQLIVHSSKVHTPQRHNSESVLYMNDDSKISNLTNGSSTEDLLNDHNFQQLRSSRRDSRLFPISTYTEPSVSLNASSSSLSDSTAK